MKVKVSMRKQLTDRLPCLLMLDFQTVFAKLSLNSTQLNSTSTQAEFSFILRQIQPPTHPSRIVVK